MFLLGILFDLLTFPVSYPLKGLKWISEKIQRQVDQEMFSPEKVEHELLELQMMHEIGDISDEEFSKKETELLDRLDELLLAKGVLQEVEEEQGVIESSEVTKQSVDVTQQKTEGEAPIPTSQ